MFIILSTFYLFFVTLHQFPVPEFGSIVAVSVLFLTELLKIPAVSSFLRKKTDRITIPQFSIFMDHFFTDHIFPNHIFTDHIFPDHIFPDHIFPEITVLFSRMYVIREIMVRRRDSQTEIVVNTLKNG